MAVLALAAGLVYFLMNLPAGAKGISSLSGEFIAFAPADAELFIAARPADIIASPLLASVVQNPQAKQGFDEMEKSLGFPVTEVEHVFAAIKVDPNAAKAGQPGAPMAGNPMMGMPGMGMPGMGGGNRSGVQDGVVILRLKQPYGGKTLDQIRQQSRPKTYKYVSYHVSADPKGGAFFFGDERHVVMGEPSQIEKIIDRKDQAENNDLLTYFAKEQHFTMVATPKGTDATTALPPGLQSPQFQNLQKLAQDISKFRMDVNMPSGVDLKLTLTCKTDAGAQQILAEANKGIDNLKQQAVVLKFMFPDIDSVLNTLKVSGSGTNVEGSVSVSSTVIDNLKKMSSQPPGAGTPSVAFTGGQLPGAPGPGVEGQRDLSKAPTKLPAEGLAPSKVSVEVTFQFNRTIGHKPDTGAHVILVPKDVKSIAVSILFPRINSESKALESAGAYYAKVGGSGKAILNRVRPGRYKMYIISENTNCIAELRELYAKIYQIAFPGMPEVMPFQHMHSQEIEVGEREDLEFSHDFGLTAF